MRIGGAAASVELGNSDIIVTKATCNKRASGSPAYDSFDLDSRRQVLVCFLMHRQAERVILNLYVMQQASASEGAKATATILFILHYYSTIMTLAIAFSNFLFIIAAYNLSKLPWYLGAAPIPSYGLEASMPFHPLIGLRGLKLWSHPVLFLAPHTIMGSTLLILFGLYLRGAALLQEVGSAAYSYFYALAVVFALHVYPERAGIPNRSKGIPLNQACIILILTATSLVLAGVIPQDAGMKIVMVPCLGAPVLELISVIKTIVNKITTKGTNVYESPDGDTPLPRNMAGYSGCPFAKACDITTQGYPSSATNKKSE